MEIDELSRVLASFEKEKLEYVLVGGTALNLHGIIRATEDIDIFIRPTPENVERLRRALRAVFDDPSIEEISAEDLCGDYPAVRYYPPHGDLFLDILTRLGEFATYDDLEAQEVDLQGIRVRVASPQTLYWLKSGTVRAIDRADAELLREKFHLDSKDRT
jgi:predicted nucleotidyltransferase